MLVALGNRSTNAAKEVREVRERDCKSASLYQVTAPRSPFHRNLHTRKYYIHNNELGILPYGDVPEYYGPTY